MFHKAEPHVLILDDDPLFSSVMQYLLKQLGIRSLTAASVDEAAGMVDSMSIGAALVDLDLGAESGFDFLHAIAKRPKSIPVIILSASTRIDDAIKALRQGAVDYLLKPVDAQKLRQTLARAGLDTISSHLGRTRDWKHIGIIGNSPALQQALKELEAASHTAFNVLITGESGTGKELFARALHQLGTRSGKPFIAVNCAALGETVFHAEMFGHRKGSFTGADESRSGYIKAADGGTLFLDEVGEMPGGMQAKLLRSIETGEFNPVGDVNAVQVDVRYVAATNCDLRTQVQRGGFRLDLFHRLNVIDIHVPPLRDRRDDIPIIADHLLRGIKRKQDAPPPRLSPGALDLLMEQDWPGNIRQLQNVLRRAASLSPHEILQPEDFSGLQGATADTRRTALPVHYPLPVAVKKAVQELEKQEIAEVLKKTDGNVLKSARLLNISRASLYRKMTKYAIAISRFRERGTLQ